MAVQLPGIKIVRRGRRVEMKIDETVFPLPVARGSVHVRVTPDDMPGVTLTLLAESVEVHDGPEIVGDHDGPGVKAHPHFDIYQDADDQWRWRVKAANGETVASGESHTRREDAERAFATAASAMMSAAWLTRERIELDV